MKPKCVDWRYSAGLSVAALGVVYGDIGTSPLYALRECFSPEHGLPATPGNVLGVLSLIVAGGITSTAETIQDGNHYGLPACVGYHF